MSASVPAVDPAKCIGKMRRNGGAALPVETEMHCGAFRTLQFFYRRYTRGNGSIRQVAGGGGTIIAATDLRGFVVHYACIAPPSFLSVVSFIDQTLPSNI